MSKDKNKIYSKFYLAKEQKLLVCHELVEGYIQYKNRRLNLCTHQFENISVDNFISTLDSQKLNRQDSFFRVTHLYYEFSALIHNIPHLDDNDILAIVMIYKKASKASLPKKELKGVEINYSCHQNHLKLSRYKKSFDFIQKNLNEGNCYQVNYTHRHQFSFSDNTQFSDIERKFWSQKEKLSAFAHSTYIGCVDKLILSNSPECLFTYSDDKIYTMPIKGTLSRNNRSLRQCWNELNSSKKDQAELDMITDLMRNDLTAIEFKPARVIKKKVPLVVPSLLHQYSVVECDISSDVSLKQIIWGLFPGGSITGAPKKSVMRLIAKIEESKRGIYCGSTIFRHGKTLEASINIRTMDVDSKQKLMTYGTGGGITLKSKYKEEFDESLAKLKSFLFTLN